MAFDKGEPEPRSPITIEEARNVEGEEQGEDPEFVEVQLEEEHKQIDINASASSIESDGPTVSNTINEGKANKGRNPN